MAYLRRQVGSAGMHYVGLLQYVGAAVMAVNRYTSVARPIEHHKVLISVVDLSCAHFAIIAAVEGRSPENRVRAAVHFGHRRTNRLSHRTAQSVDQCERGICKKSLKFGTQQVMQSLPFFVTLVMAAILTSSVIVLQAIAIAKLLARRKQMIAPANSTHGNVASMARTTNTSMTSKAKLLHFAVQCARVIRSLF